MKKLSNLTANDLRAIFKALELQKERTKGGHELWAKAEMTRPIVLQTHIDPVPEFIVKNIIRNLGITKEEFLNALERCKRA